MQQEITTQRMMGYGEHAFHIFMCFATGGLWGFAYASALRRRKTVTRISVTQLAPLPPLCTTCGAAYSAHRSGYCPQWALRRVRR